MRREGEEGGLGTVLVLNSLLYANTPVKDMGDGYLLITLPETKDTLVSYLVKPVDAKELPRYMQPTQTMLRRLEKPESVENAPARGRVSVKPVDGEALPNYMRATVAVEVAEKATKERKEAITEEMKKREEEEKELEEMKQKWEKKREEAERRHSGVY